MKSKENLVTQLIAHLVCGLFALMALLPFVLLIVASFTDNTWATANGFSFFPKKWSLDAYHYIAVQWNTIGRAYVMTIMVTAVGTAASIGDDTVCLCDMPDRGSGYENPQFYADFYHAF